MSFVYQQITRPQTYLRPVKVKCDRCGKDAGIVGGVGKDRIAWGEVSACIQGDFTLYQADLCRQCTEALVEFVNEGKGAGMQDGTVSPEVVK